MKSFGSITLILLVAAGAFAQRAQNNTDEQLAARNAPDLFVQSASAYGPDKEKKSNFTIEVKNTGKKTITAVEWIYDAPEERATGSSRQLKARNQVNIPAGEERKMAMAFPYYSEQFVSGFRLNRIRVMRVDYDDGSSWERQPEAK